MMMRGSDSLSRIVACATTTHVLHTRTSPVVTSRARSRVPGSGLLAPNPRARAAPRLSGAHVPQARASPCQNCTRMRTRLYLRLALNVSASSVSLL